MGEGRGRDAWSLVVVGLLAALLILLGALQYDWISQVSEADYERRRAQLATASARFAEDFEQELGRALHYFQPAIDPYRGSADADIEERLLERWQAWRADAPYADLVADVYVTSLRGESLHRLDPAAASFEEVAWPSDLERCYEAWSERSSEVAANRIPPGVSAPGRPGRSRQRRNRRPPPAPFFDPDAFVFVIPQRSPGSFPAAQSAAIVRLDREVVAGQLIADLASLHFAPEYAIEVRRGERGDLLYSSVPALDAGRADIVFGLAGGGPPERWWSLGPQVSRRLAEAMRRGGGPGPRRRGAAAGGVGPGGERMWSVAVVHRSGSLATVVRRARNRNLGLGLGILLVLGTSGLLLLLAVKRSQLLARQQIDFVAGLTHELHTPLAAIRSAAENLADGVVSSPQKVRTYGTLIHRQGSRLSAMVAQALEFAGMQTAQRAQETGPVRLADVVSAAAEACEGLRRERGVELCLRVSRDLPEVRGNPDALQQAVENLLGNALKHGAAGGVVRLSGTAVTPQEIELCVEDEGPGIAREDLPHLFEPFYRGRGVPSSLTGSGLGLSLVRHIVERHGGSVRGGNRREGGAVFTIRLPIAAGSEREHG